MDSRRRRVTRLPQPLLAWARNAQVFADSRRYRIQNFGVSRDGSGQAVGWVPVDRVAPAFPEEFAMVGCQMTDQVGALQSTETASDSRTTLWPADSRLAKSRFAARM